MASIGEKLRKRWNAFIGRDPTNANISEYGVYNYTSSYYRPDRITYSTNSIRSVVAAMYNKIAVDASVINIRHVRLNSEDSYQETMNSTLNDVLTLFPNKDQTGRELIRDFIQSIFDEGVAALVPYETDDDPTDTQAFQVLSVRVGRIVQWYPDHVRVDLYNDKTGRHQELVMEKDLVVIVENPFYAIMNEPNSVAQRLVRTLNQIDKINNQMASGRLDLIIQLPYSLRNSLKKEQAEERLQSIDDQLANSSRGIAYIDGTEKIVQLNRPIENKLWAQAKDLQEELHKQIGFPESILNGTADEATMLNYRNQIIEPILNAITEGMEKKWLSKTAISQKQAIRYFSQPFKLVPVSQLSEIVDKFTRNEVMTSNEFRSIMGLKPSNDPNADKLRNSNLNHPEEENIKESVNDDLV